MDEISKEGVLITRREGEIDLSNAEEFHSELLKAADSADLNLIVDLSAVTYIDSSGVRALFAVSELLETKRKKLAILLADGSPLDRLFKVTHVNEAAIVCTSEAECLERLRVSSS